MRRECSDCGSEEELPFTCRYCGQPYCSRHRLPENHACRGLEQYKEQLREEGQWVAETPQVRVQREIRDDDPGRGSGRRPGRQLGAGQAMQFLEGRVTIALLVAMGVTSVAFWLLRGVVGSAVQAHFTLGPGSLLFPWAYVSSVFSHAGPTHLLFNGLILFFFGPALERRIGSRTFLTFFLLTGVVAAVAQVALGYGLVGTGIQAPPVRGVLGASGAIMGVLGALTLLAPDAKVLLFFVLPLPLWIVTVGYAFIDLAGLIGGFLGTGGNVAHLAHLSGLAIGVWAARRYWNRPPPSARVEAWGM